MDTSYYDVVVCGPSLAGLVAASLLGRRGLRVLQVAYEGEPRFLDVGGAEVPSTPLLLPGLETPAVARVLRDLSSAQLARRRVTSFPEPLGWQAPEGRLVLSAEPGSLAASLRARFPADGDALVRAVKGMTTVSELVEPALGASASLPPQGFWERREVARLETLLPREPRDAQAALGPEHPFRAFVRALAAFTTHLGPSDIGVVASGRAFDLARRGYLAFQGGEPGFRALLTEKAGALPVDRRSGVVPIEVVLRRGRAVGVRLRPRDETIGCEAVIWAAAPSRLLGMFGEKTPRRLRELAPIVRPVCHHVTSLFLVKRQAPWARPGLTLALGDPSRPPLEDNALFVTVGEPLPRHLELVPVWVTRIVAVAALESGAAYLASVEARVRERLGRLFAGFDGYVAKSLQVELEGPLHRRPPLFSLEAPRALDIVGLPFATGVPNLYLLGPESLPGLGAEGELSAGYSLAATLSAGHHRKDLLRRTFLPS